MRRRFWIVVLLVLAVLFVYHCRRYLRWELVQAARPRPRVRLEERYLKGHLNDWRAFVALAEATVRSTDLSKASDQERLTLWKRAVAYYERAFEVSSPEEKAGVLANLIRMLSPDWLEVEPWGGYADEGKAKQVREALKRPSAVYALEQIERAARRGGEVDWGNACFPTALATVALARGDRGEAARWLSEAASKQRWYTRTYDADEALRWALRAAHVWPREGGAAGDFVATQSSPWRAILQPWFFAAPIEETGRRFLFPHPELVPQVEVRRDPTTLQVLDAARRLGETIGLRKKGSGTRSDAWPPERVNGVALVWGSLRVLRDVEILYGHPVRARELADQADQAAMVLRDLHFWAEFFIRGPRGPLGWPPSGKNWPLGGRCVAVSLIRLVVLLGLIALTLRLVTHPYRTSLLSKPGALTTFLTMVLVLVPASTLITIAIRGEAWWPFPTPVGWLADAPAWLWVLGACAVLPLFRYEVLGFVFRAKGRGVAPALLGGTLFAAIGAGLVAWVAFQSKPPGGHHDTLALWSAFFLVTAAVVGLFALAAQREGAREADGGSIARAWLANASMVLEQSLCAAIGLFVAVNLYGSHYILGITPEDIRRLFLPY